MKRILSVLLVLVMVLSMIPVIASAAETTAVFELGANGSAGHNDGTEKTTYSETVNGVTLSITGGTKMYTGACDAKGNSCIKLGTSKASGSFSITVPDDVTSVTFNVAAYKAKTATVTVNGTATKLTTKSDNGAYDAITVDTTNAKTVSFAVTSGYRAMINSIVFTVSSGSEGEETCEHVDAHDTEAVAATCTEVGYTAGVWCPDCEKFIEGHEQVPVLPHTETVTEEKAATCTEDGYTQYTCSVCGNNRKVYIDATGHNYIDGVCDKCGEEEGIVPSEATITFDDKAKRTEFTTSIQVWVENGVTVTNDKANATANIADYAKPVRFYKDSTVTVAYPGLTKIVFKCNTAQYATDLGKAITGATVTVNDKVVTVELANAVDSFTTGNLVAKVFVDSLTVYTSKVCNHVWGNAVQTLAPNCAEEGENTITCTLCGEERHESIPALGHDIVDGICSVCSGNIYPLVTTLNENDNVILYNPANKVAMANTVNSNNKMDSLSAAASNGIAVQDGMGIMTVKYVEGSETDFYLMLDGKYLNAGETGNKMYLTEEADDFAIWYMKVIDEAEGLVYLNSRNAKYNDNMQSVEYYNGSFTTYSGSGDAFKMKLYAIAGEVAPAGVAKIGDVAYSTFEDAYAAANTGDVIVLMAEITVEDDFALDKDVVIDLNGNVFNATADGMTGTVVVKDSASQYNDSDVLGVVNDNGEITVTAADGYLAAYNEDEENNTFHAYKLEITHVSLSPSADALGYKAQLSGDSYVQSAVTAYGFNMGVVNTKTCTLNAAEKPFDGDFTLRLKGILACNGGEMGITASAFVVFGAKTVTTGEQTTTLKDTLEAINNSWSSFDAVKQAAVQAYVAKFAAKIPNSWNLDSITG